MSNFWFTRKSFAHNFFFKLLVLLFVCFWLFFCATTRSQINWWIENILVILFVPWFVLFQKKFTFNNASLLSLFLFLLIHIYGAQMSYTYNQVGLWLQQNYHLERNPYDRFVHFNFGFLIAYPLYDFLKIQYKTPSRFLAALTTTIILALATIFELIEWLVAACTDSETGETYVATQGDVWDAHKDIVLAYIASFIVMLFIKLFSKLK